MSLNGSLKDSWVFISVWIFLFIFEIKIVSCSIILFFIFLFIYNLCKGENLKYSIFISIDGIFLYLYICFGFLYIFLCIYVYCVVYCVKNVDKRCERVVFVYVKVIMYMNFYLFINYFVVFCLGIDEEILMVFGWYFLLVVIGRMDLDYGNLLVRLEKMINFKNVIM